MLKQRFIEVLVDGNWEIKTYAALKKGMVFKIIDIDGTTVETPNGSGEWYALSDAEKTDGEYTVQCIYND